MDTLDSELRRRLRRASIKARVGGLTYIIFSISIVALMLHNAGGEKDFANGHGLPDLSFMTPFMVLLGLATFVMGIRSLLSGATAKERTLISQTYEAEQGEAPKERA